MKVQVISQMNLSPYQKLFYPPAGPPLLKTIANAHENLAAEPTRSVYIQKVRPYLCYKVWDETRIVSLISREAGVNS